MQTNPRTYTLDQSPLYRLRTKRRLAELLGVTWTELRQLMLQSQLYREWDEPARKGKVRHIEDPRPPLKAAQRRISKWLARITPPTFLHCPVKKRSYITNASRHIGNPIVRTLDIRDYFRATPERRVYWFFRTRMQCAQDIAAILARLSTINGHLSTGSPLSPILSYYAHVDMWEDIERIATEAGCVITVYMDDLTISGPEVSGALMWEIRQRIDRCGLEYHKEKHYRAVPAEVTGIIVKKHTIALPHRRHQATHQARQKFRLAQDEDDKVTALRSLNGHEAQIDQIRKVNLL